MGMLHRLSRLTPVSRATRCAFARKSRFHSACADSSSNVDKNAVKSCAEQLVNAAERPAGLQAVLQETCVDTRAKLASAAITACLEDDRDVDKLIANLSKEDIRALGIAAMSVHFGKDIRDEFDKVDKDHSGSVSGAEFRRYVTKVLPEHQQNDASRPTNRQLSLFALNSSIPFIVFGCLDNSIMIVGGEVVDDVIGSTLQLSTLACAAVANTFADVLGISIGNTVESSTAKLGVPPPGLTHGQTQLPLVRRIGLASGSGGIFIGCIMGMAPLLFMENDKKEDKKEECDREHKDSARDDRIAGALRVPIEDAPPAITNSSTNTTTTTTTITKTG